MNDQVKKIIKASFCPRQKWIADKDVNNCFKCDKKFHSLYRRKHHCRYCGQIFCSNCSQFFFEGKDLGQNQKQVRMCEACYQKCWKYIAKHDQTYLQFRKSGDMNKQLPQNIQQIRQKSKSSSFTQQDKIAELQAIIQQYESKSMQDIKSLQDQVMKKYSVLLQVVMKQNQIPLKYFNIILQTVKSIISKTPPNGMITGNMNICQNVRIKTFYDQNFTLQALNVVLVKKFFTNKKIKDQYQNKRAILIYGNIQAADLVSSGQKQASFQTMINNRIKQMNKLISYCQRSQIDMFLLQGTIDKQFQDMLAQNNIVVIPKIKVQHMTRVKIALKIDKIVESVRDVYSYTEQQIIGQVKKMTSLNFRSIKQGNQTKKFFLITPIKQDLGSTLIIKCDNPKLLQTLKKQFKFLLQLLVHMKLKIYKVQLDQNIFDSMSQSVKNSCYLNNPQMFFSFYAQHHSDILNYLKEKYISYKHISYVQSTFQGYPQVTRPGLQQYLKNRQHSFKNKWDTFTQICQNIFDQHRIFYSDDDTPLGSYILKKLIGIDKKCTYCCRPNYMHIDVFYSTDQYIKIWVESRIIDMEQKYLTAGQSFSQNPNEQIQMQMIFSDLSKNQIKQKLKCYIECYDCQQQISGKITLFKEHLQFSMLAFLNHIFKGTASTIIRQTNQKVGNYGRSKKACQHMKKVRVFQMGDKSLKIFVGKYITNRQCILTPTGRQNFLKIKQHKFLIQKCLLQSMKIQKVVNFLYEQIKSIAQLSKNPKFESMVKNPKTSFIRARNSIIGNGNVRLSQAQCIDMILPELIQQVNKLNNIAQLMISPKRLSHFLDSMKTFHLFVNLLKKSYVIISEVKKSVRKRDLDMKYQAKDFDNDFLLQQIDINSIADSSSIDLSSEYQHTLNGSQISTGDIYSNYNDDMNTGTQSINYQWLQPYQDQPTLNRNQRKTESNLLSKKNSKASEDQVFKLFKHFSSFLRVQYAYLTYIPCHPHHPQSLIAAALNSQMHKECLTSNSFTKQLAIRIDKIMQGQIIVQNQELRKLLTVIQVHQRMFSISQKIAKQTKNVSIQITSLYPNQFQILRKKKNIPLQIFIQSVAGSDAWMASGGKSGASFMRSFNDLIVIKKIPQREFVSFRKCLPQYFTHLHQGSLLTPVYGAFTVTKNNGNTQYFIVMENLFFGMKQWYLYDFKGSVTKRFSRPPTIPLDINYLIDRNSEPIFCKDNVLKHLGSTLDYLAKNNIVDYSLILVVQIQHKSDYYLDGNRFQIGIVDYMRDFGNLQKVQNLWKGQTGTVQQPLYYKDRMLKNLKKYFTQIPL